MVGPVLARPVARVEDRGMAAETRPGPVLVTGANSGIGLASTIRFADRGWETWGTVRSPAKAEELTRAAHLAGVGSLVHPVVLDVSDHDAVVEAWTDFPPFYAVVNNAGMSEMGAVEEVSAADAKALLDVNLVAPAVVAACASSSSSRASSRPTSKPGRAHASRSGASTTTPRTGRRTSAPVRWWAAPTGSLPRRIWSPRRSSTPSRPGGP